MSGVCQVALQVWTTCRQAVASPLQAEPAVAAKRHSRMHAAVTAFSCHPYSTCFVFQGRHTMIRTLEPLHGMHGAIGVVGCRQWVITVVPRNSGHIQDSGTKAQLVI